MRVWGHSAHRQGLLLAELTAEAVEALYAARRRLEHDLA
jgi:hypothetical protein